MSRTLNSEGSRSEVESLFQVGSGSTERRRELDVTFATFNKHERLSGKDLFTGFETLRAITYSSSAGFIRDLFERLGEIEVIFGSDVSVAGDIARLMAAQQVGLEIIRSEFRSAGKRLAEFLEQSGCGFFMPDTQSIARCLSLRVAASVA